MRALALLALCCAALALASCTRSKPTIVGTWRTPSGGQFEFRADGTVIRTLPFATPEDKYQLLDDGTLAPTLTLPHERGGNSIAARKRIPFAFRNPDEAPFTYPDGP